MEMMKLIRREDAKDGHSGDIKHVIDKRKEGNKEILSNTRSFTNPGADVADHITPIEKIKHKGKES